MEAQILLYRFRFLLNETATKFTADDMPAVAIPAEQLSSLKPLAPLNYTPKPTNPYAWKGW